MNKDEIKKALECCETDWCCVCPYYKYEGCETILKKDVLALITEQEKEIDRLKAENEKRLTCDFVKTAQKQAQIDILNKLRRRSWQGYQIGMYIVSTQEIDELIKEVENEN